MNEFLKIKTLFDSIENRTIEKLSEVYSDKSLLKSVISELLNDKLLRDAALAGKKILLKPNWVRHSLHQHDEICLRTNDNFL
jgi:hypothetical protein